MFAKVPLSGCPVYKGLNVGLNYELVWDIQHVLFYLWDFITCKVAVTVGKFYRHFRVIFERHCGCGLESCITYNCEK